MYQESQYFAEELQEISEVYIKTPSFGNIYAKAVGKHGQPLIIVVHGSGPKNSSDQYNYLLHEYLFFILAIDCPGYGQSKGSKQAIKTFPLKMFKQILNQLKYKTYFGMFGHSQGGAAIFNAVHQDPSITEFLLMDRPVCGNIKRFQKFTLPTLLIYDIEDDGHPIWQGKLLFKQLQTSQLYTYRGSRDPYYVPDNLWNLIISFIHRYSSNRKGIFKSSRGFRQNKSRSLNQQKRENFSKEKEQKQEKYKRSIPTKKFKKQKNLSMDKFRQKLKEKEEENKNIMEDIPEIQRSQIYSRIEDLEQFQDLPINMNQKKVQQSPQQALKYEQVIYKPSEQAQNPKNYQSQIKTQKLQKKQQQENKKTSCMKKQDKQPEQKKQKHKTQQQEQKCSICYDIFFEPVQTNCKHNFCKKCIGESYLVDVRCPLCRTKITSRKHNLSLKQSCLQKLNDDQKQRKNRELHKFQQMLKRNNSKQLSTKPSAFSKVKKKYIWELYAKQPKNFKFEEVQFNINMGERDSKPVKITHAPFVFQSRGTFSFTCEITIKPRNKQYSTITSVYRIDVTPGNHSKMISLKKNKF